MKKKSIYRLIVCIGFVLICNYPPVYTFIHLYDIIDMQHYSYSNSDDTGSIFYENFGSTFSFRTTVSDGYRKEHPLNDTLLYRNFTINPLCFWRWREYIVDKKYKLPYISLEDVKSNSAKLKNRKK